MGGHVIIIWACAVVGSILIMHELYETCYNSSHQMYHV